MDILDLIYCPYLVVWFIILISSLVIGSFQSSISTLLTENGKLIFYFPGTVFTKQVV